MIEPSRISEPRAVAAGRSYAAPHAAVRMEMRGAPPHSADRAAAHAPATARLVWVELLKAVALIWICLNHLTERLFGYPYIANPSNTWPRLAERIAQLQPLTEPGWWALPVNVLRYLGWAGDQGVQLFLILSGFGLTWGLLARQGFTPLNVRTFYVGRAVRIYPTWWAAHLALLAAAFLLGKGLLLNDPGFYLSAIGLRVTPQLLYSLVPAWWYVGLLIQLCLVYPLLWEGLRRRGPLWLLVVSCGCAFVLRGAGLVLLPHGVDAWSRGAIFITRLPEFVCGISLAAWLFAAPARTDARLRSGQTLVSALVMYAVGTLLSLNLLGMTVAPAMLGVAAFVLLYALLAQAAGGAQLVRPWVWTGRHSYSLFLVHQPVIAAMIPGDAGAGRTAGLIAGTAAAVLLTIVGALALERAAELMVGVANPRGRVRAARVATIGGLLFTVLIGADLLIRHVDPQEALGWGERPSLEPDAAVGWRLKPSQRTHLRWESYDYSVTANALGFPGPEYPIERAAETVRIFVTGDAFTSAEGVDTELAWPRLLERDLAARLPGRTVQVLNFAVTGYGPNQYAAVTEKFAPLYRPDLIVIGFFVNDFEDVLTSTEEFRASIGFDRPAPDSWISMLTLAHLRPWLKLHAAEPLYEMLRRRPGPHGYFLGQFAALERDRPDLHGAGRQRVAERLAEITRVARTIGARVLIAMIPAPVQICGPSDLAYYPHHVDLRDTQEFDADGPQRTVHRLADALHIGFFDLRPTLQTASGGCPYQSHNLHWTVTGHRAVAQSLAEYVQSHALVGHPTTTVGNG